MECKKRTFEELEPVRRPCKMQKYESNFENDFSGKFIGLTSSVKSFYGNKNKPQCNSNHKWGIWPKKYLASSGVKTKKGSSKDVKQSTSKIQSKLEKSVDADLESKGIEIETNSDSEPTSVDSSLCIKKRIYRCIDVSDLYGKRTKKLLNKNDPNTTNYENKFLSVESQTSFPSSPESNETSSPISSFRSSPFICSGSLENYVDQSLLFFSDTDASSTNFQKENRTESNSTEKIVSTNDSSLPINLSSKKDDAEPVTEGRTPYDIAEKTNGTEVPVDIQTNIVGNEFVNNDNKVLNTSLTSDGSPNENGKMSKRTCKRNTLFNYFHRTDSLRKKNKLKTPDTGEHKLIKPKTSPRQLQLTEKGKSPPSQDLSDAVPMFNLPISPRQNSIIKKKFMSHKILETKSYKTQKKEQMYIDIGQKDFGHVTCPTCGMIYTKSQEEDEAQHAKYHQKVVQKLKFNGWKKERVLQEFHDGRIIMIRHSDNHLHLKKLNEVKEVVDAELGFTTCQDLHPKSEQQAYLFVCSKKVIGCAIAMLIKKAYPVIPTPELPSPEKEIGAPTLSWCCSTDPVSAICGISRIWVFSQCRRQKIASRIVDCIRQNFLYGCIITKEKIAFSDPTPNGRVFAEKYTGKSEILVFR